MEERPQLSELIPSAVQSGSTVAIVGVRLQDVTKVSFTGTEATSPKSVNATTVVVEVPSSAISGPVSVQSPAGKSNALDLELVNGVDLTPPRIEAVDPDPALPNRELSILGENLSPLNGLTLAGEKLPTTTASADQVTTRLP
ncbi:MAG: IPT/TIG domain-containing protein, partial [Myxococcota bacterium]